MKVSSASTIAALSVLLFASGCAAPERTGQRQFFEPAPLHDPFLEQGQHVAMRLVAHADRPTTLNVWFSLRRDCSLSNYFRLRVVFPPKHGSVTIRTGLFRPAYPQDTYRHDCNLELRDGIAAFYQPAPGYVGPDELTLKIDTPSGKSWNTDFEIDVR